MPELRTLRAGSVLPDAILRVARKEKVHTATFMAIGGVDEVTIAYYSRRKKRYEEHSYRGFMEVTSMLGNISDKDGEPFLHLHGTFGRRDLSVIGGHVIRARVFPTLEFVLAPTANKALRKLDQNLGLNLVVGSQ